MNNFMQIICKYLSNLPVKLQNLSAFLIRFTFFISSVFLLIQCDGHPHSGAHVHGVGHLSIAFDSGSSKSGSIELKIAAEDLYSNPANAHLNLSSAASGWSAEGRPNLQFPAADGCTIQLQTISETQASNNHKDILVLYTFLCDSQPSSVTIDMSAFSLKELYVQILSEERQTSKKIPGKGGELNLEAP